MGELNPRAMITLWHVERLGSLSAVARETGWSQPAISQQIKKLEKDCGVPLLRRTSHGVELTEFGTIVSHYGQLIANRITQAQRDIEERRTKSSTHIRLVAPPSACSTIVAKVIAHMSKESSIRISLMQMEPPEALEALAQGIVDCAITFTYNSIPRLLTPSEELQAEYIGDDPLLLLVSAHSDIGRAHDADPRPINLKEARSENWIAGCDTCQANLISMSKSVGFSPTITHATDDYWATQNLVQLGMGISIVPRLNSMTYLRDDLRACDIEDVNAFRKMYFVYRKGDDRLAIEQTKLEIERVSRRHLVRHQDDDASNPTSSSSKSMNSSNQIYEHLGANGRDVHPSRGIQGEH